MKEETEIESQDVVEAENEATTEEEPRKLKIRTQVRAGLLSIRPPKFGGGTPIPMCTSPNYYWG